MVQFGKTLRVMGFHRSALVLILALSACASGTARQNVDDKQPSGKQSADAIRVATFNTSLNDDRAGGLIARLRAGDSNAKKAAAVIQRNRPDVVLLNEFDFDAAGEALALFQRDYLSKAQFGERAIVYPYHFIAPVNTGVLTGLDLNHDGCMSGPNDAFGFGRHPGQYGMVVLSMFPIDTAASRTFQKTLWRDLPDATSPINPTTKRPWYPAATWNQLRLSSKSHWDVVVKAPHGDLHVLASHPTPPVFDGPEDRHGIRNRDEIRFWQEYLAVNGAMKISDDQGRVGGLSANAKFVIVGDMNADPFDGEGLKGGINVLLAHPHVLQASAPASVGARESAARIGKGNLNQKGDAATDTGQFFESIGNLRIDYVLPSANLKLRQQSVFWPVESDPASRWLDASDHRMVWADLSF